jgi:hypothetical protein
MRPQAPRRPLTARTIEMPAFQRLGRFPERRDGFGRIEQASIVAVRAAEMLTPQLQPQVSGELSGSVSKARRIEWLATIALFVDHGARDLGVVAPGPPIEIVGAHGCPDVIDHADLGVDVHRNAREVLDVVDRDTITTRIEKNAYRLLASDLVRSQGEG